MTDKNIGLMAQKFAASFLGQAHNLQQGGIVYALFDYVKSLPLGQALQIQFYPPAVPDFNCNDRIKAAITRYQEKLADYAAAHQADLNAVKCLSIKLVNNGFAPVAAYVVVLDHSDAQPEAQPKRCAAA